MPERVLPYGRHEVSPHDIQAVCDVLNSDYLTTGPAVEEFEASLAGYVGAGSAVACSSGTAALHMALLAAGVGEGDRVIVPSVTFLATANAVRLCNAEVVFADVDPDTGLLTPDSAREAIDRAGAEATTAIIPVHLGGQTAPMQDLARLAKEHDFVVIEDACHALGAQITNGNEEAIHVGQCDTSLMCAFSFHPVKAIAAGEGGAVTANDPEIADRLMIFRNHGMVREPEKFRYPDQALDERGEPNAWYYEMAALAPNYRLDALSCALANSQLATLDTRIARRREIAALYDRLLAPLAPTVRPVPSVADCDSAHHLYCILVNFEAAGISRNRLMTELRSRGIGSQVHYIPVHRQPYYRDRYGELGLPGADRYYERTLSLPIFPAMSDDDVGSVIRELSIVLAGGGVSRTARSAAV